MTKSLSVTLGERYDAFIERQVATGRFASPSDAVRAALRLLEEEDEKLDRLRDAIDEGDVSGEPEPLDIEEFIQSKRRRG